MINEIEALLGILILVIMLYFFLYKRSKILGSMALLMSSLALLVPFGGTDYEMIAWIGIMISLTSLIAEFGHLKLTHVKS